MKKFLATFLAVALAAVACCVFASAEDTNIALGKSYTTIGIYLLETETQPIYIDEEGKTLTDGVKGYGRPRVSGSALGRLQYEQPGRQG